MKVLFANNYSTILTSAITASDTSIPVASVSGLPAVTAATPAFLTIQNLQATQIEVVRLTDIVGNNLTVTRGQDGTTGLNFVSGSIVEMRIPRIVLDNFATLEFGGRHYPQFRLLGRDQTHAITANIIGDFILPFDGTFIQDDVFPERLFAWTDVPGSGGGTMVVDVNLNGVSIMSTNKLVIESGDNGTQTATTQPDLTTTAFTAGAILTFDIDSTHSTPGTGCVVGLGLQRAED